MPLDTSDPLAVRRTGSRLMWTFGLTLVAAFLVVAAPLPSGLVSLLVLTPTQQIVLVALVCGALGGSIHVATSFADYVGSGMYDPRWLWWYALRPLIGAGLALIFLAVMQAGWLPILSSNPDQRLWGAAAVSGLVGLFSKQAVDKLADVFDAILKTDKDTRRKDSLASQPVALTLTAVTPAEVQAGSGAQTVVVTGTGLPEKPLVRFNGKDRTATVDAARTSLQVALVAEDVVAPGNYTITVGDAAPGAAPTSASIPFGVKVQVGAGAIVDGSQPAAGGAATGAAAAGGADGAQPGAEAAVDAAAEHPIQVPDEDESGGEAEGAAPQPDTEETPVVAGAGAASGAEASVG